MSKTKLDYEHEIRAAIAKMTVDTLMNNLTMALVQVDELVAKVAELEAKMAPAQNNIVEMPKQ